MRLAPYQNRRARPSCESRVAAFLCFAIALGVSPRRVDAHAYGTSSVNRYLGVELETDGVHLAYVLEFAELPAVREIAQLDPDGDGAVTPHERDAYLAARLPGIVAQWSVEIDGARSEPGLVRASVETQPGQAGLTTLRVLAEFRCSWPRPPGAIVRVAVRDSTFADRPGYRDLRAGGTNFARLVTTDARDEPDALALRRIDAATFTFDRASTTTRIEPRRPRFTTRAIVTLVAALLFAAFTIAALFHLARRRQSR